MLNFVLLIMHEMQGGGALVIRYEISFNDLEFFHFLSFTVTNLLGSESSNDTRRMLRTSFSWPCCMKCNRKQ